MVMRGRHFVEETLFRFTTIVVGVTSCIYIILWTTIPNKVYIILYNIAIVVLLLPILSTAPDETQNAPIGILFFY